MKRNCVISLFICFFSCQLLAGPISAQDGTGYVQSFGRLIHGTITVNLVDNHVVVKSGLNISHLPSNKVQKITLEDRVYYSGVFAFNNESILFTALVDGSIPLLYREGLKLSAYDDRTYPPFFIMKNDGVYALGQSKKEVVAVFDEAFQNEMSEYIQKDKLDLKSKEDLIIIFSYYDSLQQGLPIVKH